MDLLKTLGVNSKHKYRFLCECFHFYTFDLSVSGSYVPSHVATWNEMSEKSRKKPAIVHMLEVLILVLFGKSLQTHFDWLLSFHHQHKACLTVHLCIFCGFWFLAHLSRRLTRWAYSIPMIRRPSVVRHRHRCPHFQTWISLKPIGQSWSNFMCSITGVGERLHKALGQIGSKLWFPWQ